MIQTAACKQSTTNMYEPHKVFNFETEFMINITIEDIKYKLKYIHIYHGIQVDYLPK